MTELLRVRTSGTLLIFFPKEEGVFAAKLEPGATFQLSRELYDRLRTEGEG